MKIDAGACEVLSTDPIGEVDGRPVVHWYLRSVGDDEPLASGFAFADEFAAAAKANLELYLRALNPTGTVRVGDMRKPGEVS